jgi:hypothetical protein
MNSLQRHILHDLSTMINAVNEPCQKSPELQLLSIPIMSRTVAFAKQHPEHSIILDSPVYPGGYASGTEKALRRASLVQNDKQCNHSKIC